MRAMVLKAPRELIVEEIPEFTLRPTDVMVEPVACGVCGSDLRYFVGENPWAQHTLGRFMENPPNIVPGHEFCGSITAVGSSVDPGMVGKRVVVQPLQVCGECEQCRSGYNNLCPKQEHLGHGGGWGDMKYYPGGMAQRCPVWASCCFEVPDSLPDREAALMDMLAVAVHASNLGRITADDRVAIIGSGPIGLSIAQVARSRGASKVALFDPSSTARDVARSCGMDDVYDVPCGDIETALKPMRGRATKVYDTVGRPNTLKAGLETLRFAGELIVMAAHGEQLPFSMEDVGQERCIRTSCNFVAPTDFQEAIRLATTGGVRLAPYITREVPLSVGPHAIESMIERRDWAFKCVIHPQM
jgi:L-iditol 2-dehydrogenase